DEQEMAARFQSDKRAETCNSPGLMAVVPNLGVSMKRLGLPRLTLWSALKAWPRSSRAEGKISAAIDWKARNRHERGDDGMSAEAWPKIAVVGAGAVGGYFGGVLARAGAPVVFIGRPPFVEAVNRGGLLLDTVQFQEKVKAEASTELAAARDAEIVLFC